MTSPTILMYVAIGALLDRKHRDHQYASDHGDTDNHQEHENFTHGSCSSPHMTADANPNRSLDGDLG